MVTELSVIVNKYTFYRAETVRPPHDTIHVAMLVPTFNIVQYDF